MNPSNYRRLIRVSAAYDIVATAGFATPWTLPFVYAQLNALSPIPAFEPVHTLIANLLGSIVLVWATLRLWQPQPVFGLFDAFARGLFLAWQLYYLLVMQGAAFVWVFALFEALFGIAQGWGYWILRRRDASLWACASRSQRTD